MSLNWSAVESPDSRRTVAGEFTAVLVILVALEYYYVAAGLPILPVALGQLVLLIGMVAALTVRFYRGSSTMPSTLLLTTGLLLLALGVAIGPAVVASSRLAIYVLAGSTGVLLYTSDWRPRLSGLLVSVLGCSLVVGGFSPDYVATALSSSSPGVSVELQVGLAKTGVYLAGTPMPVLRSSRPGYIAEIALLQVLLGCTLFVIGRIGFGES
jgi:hypothetical protein